MIDWRGGGPTGSLNAWVSREVRLHLRANPAARKARYTWAHRLLRGFFSIATFARFIGLYVCLCLLVVAAETFAVQFGEQEIAQWLPPVPWPLSDQDALLLNISGYLIGAQVGLLSVVSISIALVSLIAQRENAETDVKVYYHEALAFELVASNVALLTVLCLQLLWPFQTVLSLLGASATLITFKPFLLGVHLVWLTLNLLTVAFFIATTLRFVQDKSRQEIRERYIVNITHPSELSARMRRSAYRNASLSILRSASEAAGQDDQAAVFFGSRFDEPQDAVLEATFHHSVMLHDVHMGIVKWVLLRWKNRSLRTLRDAARDEGMGGGRRPLIWFPIDLNLPVQGTTPICFQRHGAELTRLEKLLLRYAFCFRRVRDEV
ncbi:hypothetical protein [Hyphomonas sp. CACIAM 19H1]|uniref:hypothetical protein n=1 Tax=Hyphomonas sp. CACIAM 19H1 TaxID=1873716 RepID=UPI0013B05523|nr:hypothetical protein [Hyphomonas sp. CACIAM 19H1]